MNLVRLPYHRALDKAVDNSYRTKLFKANFKDDTQRLAFLFERYHTLNAI